MTGFFESQAPRPLADRLRPKRLEEIVGQDHLLAADGPIGRMLAARPALLDDPLGAAGLRQDHDRPPAGRADLDCISSRSRPCSRASPICARSSRRRKARRMAGQGTLLFIDEIHRFNRAQQDGFLPYVEDGTVILVGATTENPSFELNGALALALPGLRAATGSTMPRWSSCWPRRGGGWAGALPLDAEARRALRAMADGDGRYLLNMAEELLRLPPRARRSTPPAWRPRCSAARRSTTRRRKATTTSSAPCTNRCAAPTPMRRSTGSPACSTAARTRATSRGAWCASRSRISAWPIPTPCRRPSPPGRPTSGWARPRASSRSPNASIYLGTAPKSNAAYRAFSAARSAAEETGSLMPPKHILNAPTRLMKRARLRQGLRVRP